MRIQAAGGSLARLSKNTLVENFGGKKSVKGNRQGVLSRSITRPQAAKSRNNWVLFRDFEGSLSKESKGLF